MFILYLQSKLLQLRIIGLWKIYIYISRLLLAKLSSPCLRWHTNYWIYFESYFFKFVNASTICRNLRFVEPQKNPFVCFGELQWWHVYCFKQINKSYVLSENNVLRTLDYILTSKYSETENTYKDVIQSNWAKNVQDRKWKNLIPLGSVWTL